MPSIVIGVLAALGASALYAVGMVLQAAEARDAPAAETMRVSLLRRLVRRPRWVAGTAIGLGGWALQAYALTKAPLTLVQPLLAMSLPLQLLLGRRRLGERVGAAEYAAVAAIVAGCTVLAIWAPARDSHAAGLVRTAICLAVLGALALLPVLLRNTRHVTSVLVAVGAGLGYSFDSVATKFFSDALAAGAAVAIGAWFVAMNIASGVGTLAEMSALQHRAVSIVSPIVFTITTLVPVALAPLLFGEAWPSAPLRVVALAAALALVTAGVLVLAASKPIAGTLGDTRREPAAAPSAQTARH